MRFFKQFCKWLAVLWDEDHSMALAMYAALTFTFGMICMALVGLVLGIIAAPLIACSILAGIAIVVGGITAMVRYGLKQ